jgi:hypothetical protein
MNEDDVKPIKIQGTIMWACLDTPNKMSGEYQVDLCNLSDAAIEVLQGLKIPVKIRDDQPEKGHFITAKSKNFVIKATDAEGKPITAKVGNGSKGVGLITPYPWNHKPSGKKGVGAGIRRIIVTDLIVYEAQEAVVLDDDVL